MRKQFHSGNILNKKFHLEMVRDLKADCAKRTEEVCSGFCNIGSGVSLNQYYRNPTSFPMLMLIGIIFMIKISFTFYNKISQETERLQLKSLPGYPRSAGRGSASGKDLHIRKVS